LNWSGSGRTRCFCLTRIRVISAAGFSKSGKPKAFMLLKCHVEDLAKRNDGVIEVVAADGELPCPFATFVGGKLVNPSRVDSQPRGLEPCKAEQTVFLAPRFDGCVVCQPLFIKLARFSEEERLPGWCADHLAVFQEIQQSKTGSGEDGGFGGVQAAPYDLAINLGSGILVSVGHVLQQIGNPWKRPPLPVLGRADTVAAGVCRREFLCRCGHANQCCGIQ
jgi:hypothetical protein